MPRVAQASFDGESLSMGSSLAQRVAQRHLTAVQIPDSWFKERTKDLKARLKEPVQDSPDVWPWLLEDRIISFFNQLERNFNQLVGQDQARESVKDRVELIKGYLEAVVAKLRAIREASKAQPYPDKPSNYLYWHAYQGVFDKMKAPVKTLGDLLKNSWFVDDAVIAKLVKKTIKAAKPEDLQDALYLLADAKFEAAAQKALKKTKLDKDISGWVDFLKEVLEANYTDQALQEKGALREFDLKGMKVVIDDSTVENDDIPKYVRLLLEAHHRLRAKGLEEAWYGTTFIKCEECGGKNQNTGGAVGGHYHIGPNTVTCYVRPRPFVVELMLHELGHRYWFKHMRPEQRQRFNGLIKTYTKARPNDAVKMNLWKIPDTKWWKGEVTEARNLLQREIDAAPDGSINVRRIMDLSQNLIDGALKFLKEDPIEGDLKTHQDELWDAKNAFTDVATRPPNFGNEDSLLKWMQESERLLRELTTEAYVYIDIKRLRHNEAQKALALSHAPTKEWLESYDQNPNPVVPVSDYGKSDPDEAFAEVFAHYCLNEDMSRDQMESFRSVLSERGSNLRKAEEVLARFLTAQEFPNQKALRQYLKDHPAADKSKHSVAKKPAKQYKDYVKTDPKLFEQAKSKAAKTKWIRPDYAEEGVEVERTAKTLGIPEAKMKQAWDRAKVEPLAEEAWSQLENTDSYDTDTLEKADKLAEQYDRNIPWTLQRMGGELPAPIVLLRKGKPPYLIGGNTRLMISRALGAKPQVLTLRV